MKPIRRAAEILKGELTECVLFSTHEPCPMCSTAALWSGIKEVAYGYPIKEAILEACKILGIDTRLVCRYLTEEPTNDLLFRVNPRLAFKRNYNKIRPHAAYCEEMIILGRQFSNDEDSRRKMMNFQNEKLPEGATKAGATPSMTEETVAPGILKRHLAPKGKFGYLVVEEGSLQFVWEDDEDNVLDADPDHPIVIFPERYHHVSLTGRVRFRVEFYDVGGIDIAAGTAKKGERPGEDFIP